MSLAQEKAQEGGRRRLLAVFLILTVVSVVAHINAFFVTHVEGDERVYHALAREMTWALGNYTTKNDPEVSEFPYTIYQGDVFHHPPLIPFILKVGMALGEPLILALLFEMAVAILLIAVGLALARAMKAELPELIVVGLLFTCCPLVLATTSKVFLDGPGAVFCFAGIGLLILALKNSSKPLAVLSAASLILGLNARYSSILILPILALVQLLHLVFNVNGFDRKEWRKSLKHVWVWEHWKLFAIVLAIVLPLGMQHYVRVGLTYGSILPGSIYGPRPERFTYFLTLVEGRSRIRMIMYLLVLFPMLALTVLPPYWRALKDRLKEKDLFATMLLAFPYLLVACLLFQHVLLRYYLIAMPFFYISVIFMLRDKSPVWRNVTRVLIVISLISMILTSFTMTIVKPTASRIFPAGFYYIRPMQKYYQ